MIANGCAVCVIFENVAIFLQTSDYVIYCIFSHFAQTDAEHVVCLLTTAIFRVWIIVCGPALLL